MKYLQTMEILDVLTLGLSCNF